MSLSGCAGQGLSGVSCRNPALCVLCPITLVTNRLSNCPGLGELCRYFLEGRSVSGAISTLAGQKRYQPSLGMALTQIMLL